MPNYDLFGNPIYSKEELQAKAKEEAETKKKQLEEAKKKQAKEQKAKEEATKLTKKREELKTQLQSLIESSNSESEEETDDLEANDELQADIDSIDSLEMKGLNELEKKYSKQLKKASKPKKEEVIKYKYPFILHLAGRNIETDHIFEEGKEYTEAEITTKMREHQYYDFAGSVKFEYIKEENVLLPIFQQHKKG